MDLKIRLPESLDQRLRAHAQNTGATLNSIICLAIDAFVPGGVKPEKPMVEAPAPEPVKPVKPEKPVIVVSKQPVQPIPPKPKMSSKPTKQELRKMSEWHRLYGAKQGDLL